ncbi:MAG: Gfo/Idh/MocA family protein [Candidatus Heimdallarchaeota archaeon]
MKIIAIVGLGKWGKNHVRNIVRLQSEGFCDKVVICDADKKRLESIGNVNNISNENRYDDLDKLLKNEKLAGAVLAIPTAIHKKIALQVLEHCDILLEKPLAPTVEECQEISEKAKKLNRIIQVGHLERYNPVVVTLKSFLEKESTEDKIMHITGRRVGPGPMKLDSKDLDPNYLGCNPILFDCRATWRAYPNLKRRKLIVQTTKDVMTLDFILQSIIMEKGLAQHSLGKAFSDYLGAYRATEVTSHFLAAGKDQEPLYLQDKDFLSCLDTRKKPLVSDKEGTDAVKCVVAAIEAAKTGKAVEIK